MTLSVVLCTFNRAASLERALTAVTRAAVPGAELIVVDNNSSDSTQDVVRRFLDGPLRVRCIRERRQGLSFARNAGICVAAGDLLAFTDDDVEVDCGWIAAIQRAFERFPDAAWIGGKVLPRWPVAPPAWLTAARHAPLALVDYGDEPFPIAPQRSVCVVGANMAIRRAALESCGLFAASVQRRGNGAGTTEDHELQLRLMAAGFSGVYDPSIVVHAPVDLARMTKAFHRRWHYHHGRSFAVMRDDGFERSRQRICGVPTHVLRSFGAGIVGATSAVIGRRADEAFEHELRARFAAGFLAARLLHPSSVPSPSLPHHSSATVSVVIPCFNQARFVDRAIRSALAQSVPNIEVIVVDDGSIDETQDVAQKYSTVGYYRQTNRGVAAARNAGLAQARGDFVIFLDADDELMPDAAGAGIDALRSHPEAAYVAGTAIPIDRDGVERSCATPTLGTDDRRRYDELLMTNFIWTPGAAMFRRALLLRAGGFDESLSRSADYALYLRLAREWPVHWHGRAVVRYRQHAAAMSTNPAAMLRETLRVLRSERRAMRIDRRRWRRITKRWTEWYADQIADVARAALRQRDYRSLLSSALALAWLHPAGAVEHSWRAVRAKRIRPTAYDVRQA